MNQPQIKHVREAITNLDTEAFQRAILDQRNLVDYLDSLHWKSREECLLIAAVKQGRFDRALQILAEIEVEL